jgi:hypothetical protein
MLLEISLLTTRKLSAETVVRLLRIGSTVLSEGECRGEEGKGELVIDIVLVIDAAEESFKFDP